MKAPSVSLLLGVSILLLPGPTVSAVSLNISSNLQQFFSGDSVSLTCVEDGQRASGSTVKRNRGGQTEDCGADQQHFGLFQGSSCVLDLLLSYSGVYWCETSLGQRSDQITISVFRKEAVPFILEIPALPVVAGNDVTLRCRNKDGSTRAAYFFRNSKVTGDRVKVQEFTISNAQQSDEGLYSCSTDVSEPSPQSWLRVTGQDDEITSSPLPTTDHLPSTDSSFVASTPVSTPPASSTLPPLLSVSVIRLFLHLLVFCPFCISTGLMVSFCCSRRTGYKVVSSMEMNQHHHVDEENDYVTIDVITGHDLRAAPQ